MKEFLEEAWRPVLGHEGSYEVSDLGRVRTFTRGRDGHVLAFGTTLRGGYLKVGLYRGRKRDTRRVHRLVLEAFVGPRPGPTYHGAHLDGDPTNNRLSNLRWVTRKENEAHKLIHGTRERGERHHHAKLNTEMVLELCEKYAKGAPKMADLAAEYGVSRSTINDVFLGNTWRHVTGRQQRRVRRALGEKTEP